MQTRNKLKELYSGRREHFLQMHEADRNRMLLLSILRLIVFVGGIIASVLIFRIGNIAGFTSLFLSIVIFGILLKRYSLRAWSKSYNSNMIRINKDDLNSVDEDYSGFESGQRYTDPSHSFSHDLDLFGKGSLFQSINRTTTERGMDLLASWLKDPFRISDQFSERKESISELSDELEWRQRFAALGMMNSTSEKETTEFYSWMKEPSYFSKKKYIQVIVVLMPGLTLLMFALGISNIVSLSFFVVLLLLNLALLSVNLRIINRTHSMVTKRNNYLSVVSTLIKHIEAQSFKSPYLLKLKSDLGEDNIPALEKVNKLARIIHSFDSRLNMIMGVVLNGFLLWDYQCIIRIEKWKNEVSHLVPKWFETIAYIDALSSLADYSFNNPGYVMPELSTDGSYLTTRQMGHHLINSNKRVVNDYSISGKGVINIITGANMAGKSTFLRTVGTNLILSMCGAPVCASEFIFTPVEIFTSMRTSDSLSEDESYFFAELKRLRMLIEKVEVQEKFLFILDEILKGTNSKDKSEGSQAFIEKVITMQGTGLVATHDVSLGSLEKKHPDKVLNYCFEIEIEAGEVHFDYLLRAGITTKMNAALLMKQQGII